MIKDVALLMVKLLMELLSGDDSAKFWWKEHMVLHFLWGTQICCTRLQVGKHYCKMDSRNDKLGQHNGYR